MKSKRQIFLYGNSVILGSIGAILRRYSDLEVTTLAIPLQEWQDIDDVKPDLLLFDTDTCQADTPFFLLKTNPALLLIDVSSGTNLIRVWNGQQLWGMSLQDLIELIGVGAEVYTDAQVKLPIIRKMDSGRNIDVRS
jgi:hypothetical protein